MRPIPNRPSPRPTIGITLLPVNASEPSLFVVNPAVSEPSEAGDEMVSPNTCAPSLEEGVSADGVSTLVPSLDGVAALVPSPDVSTNAGVSTVSLVAPSPEFGSMVVVVLRTTIVLVEVVDVVAGMVVVVGIGMSIVVVVVASGTVVVVSWDTTVVVVSGSVVVVSSAIVVLVVSSTVVVVSSGAVVVVSSATVVEVEASSVVVVESSVDEVVVVEQSMAFMRSFDIAMSMVVEVVVVSSVVDVVEVEVGQQPDECVEANAGTVRRPAAANRMPAPDATMRRARRRFA